MNKTKGHLESNFQVAFLILIITDTSDMKSILLFATAFAALVFFGGVMPLAAQNTVGLISFNPEQTLGGYNLIYPDRQSTTYLLDECGQVVHRWDDAEATAVPGAVAYLLPDGRLLRAKLYRPRFNSATFGGGGAGGVVELVSWDNEVEWTYVVADSLQRQHHDVHYLPNGHVLILAYDRISLADMLTAGFDTTSYVQRRIWSEKVIEVDPATDSIIWQWRVWDHLVQDFDSLAQNYGIVGASPGRIDVNYHEYDFTREDWIHANALDYNPVLDQVMINARNFNEIWIIDHSTTTAEAATSSGGNSGRGGDLLWRWGSPQAYQQGNANTTQLFYQHDAQWIDDFVDPNYAHYGAMAVFNNQIDFSTTNPRSQGQVISPVWDVASQSYGSAGGTFLPATTSATFTHPNPQLNYSATASSIQLLGNGHVIMCAATQGFSFELDEAGAVVWEYLVPLFNGQPFPQGSSLPMGVNSTFRWGRYPRDYAAFAGRDLTPQGYLELLPNEDFCTVVATQTPQAVAAEFAVFPNPARGTANLHTEPHRLPLELEVYNARGQRWQQLSISSTTTALSVTDWPAGLYLLYDRTTGQTVRLVVK